MSADDEPMILQTTRVFVDGFRDMVSSEWLDFEAALSEVRESLGLGRVSRVALEDSGAVVGWKKPNNDPIKSYWISGFIPEKLH